MAKRPVRSRRRTGRGRTRAGARGALGRRAPLQADRFHAACTIPGFERVAAGEVKQRLEPADVQWWRGWVTWRPACPARELLSLRCTEDVFAGLCIVEGVGRSRAHLGRIYRAVAGSEVEWAVSAYRECNPAARGRRVRLRVISRMEGRRNFLRADLGRAVERALVDRSGGRWRLVDEGGMEVWVDLQRERCVVAVRLSTAAMRHRGGRRVELPAALRPSAAACLVRMSRPASGGVFLDPCCGGGTILAERLAAGDGAVVVGADISQKAVAASALNVKGGPLHLLRADARRLPLKNACVDAIATNLPFGGKVGRAEELPGLYRGILAELARVGKRGCRAAVLVGDAEAAEAILRRMPSWRIVGRPTNVDILGRRASVLLLERR